jgi:hypothetical protein
VLPSAAQTVVLTHETAVARANGVAATSGSLVVCHDEPTSVRAIGSGAAAVVTTPTEMHDAAVVQLTDVMANVLGGRFVGDQVPPDNNNPVAICATGPLDKVE